MSQFSKRHIGTTDGENGQTCRPKRDYQVSFKSNDLLLMISFLNTTTRNNSDVFFCCFLHDNRKLIQCGIHHQNLATLKIL